MEVSASLRPPGTRGAGRWFWTGFMALLAVQCLPFLFTATPALLDYPNHLARIFILAHGAGDSFLSAYYQPHWQVLPNLAMDGLGVVLAHLLPIYAAGQAMLLIAVLLLASGLAALSWALHGRPRPFCLLGFLFLFSEPFAWGFINLILGYGLVLLGVAGWIRVRERPLAVALGFSVPFALLLFFAHLFAFGAYGLILAGIELAALRSAPRGAPPRPLAALGRATLLGAAQAALPLVLLLFVSPTPLADSSTRYGSLTARLVSMPLAPVRNFSDVLDVLAVAAVATLLLFGFASRRLRIPSSMRVALGLLLAASFLVPGYVSSAENLEIRLPVMAALLLAASGDWIARERRELPIGIALFAALFAARTVAVMLNFAAGDRFVGGLEQALASVPRGARIAAMTITRPGQTRTEATWKHAICYQVIEKSALVPSLFANPEQQPLVLRPPYDAMPFPPDHFLSSPGRPPPRSWFRHLDYLVVINPAALQAPLPPRLRPLGAGPQFRLYRASD